MTESSGARIALGLGIVAVLIGLAVILEQVSGTERAEPDAVESTAVPTDLQFCIAWRSLSAATGVDRAGDTTTSPDDLRSALTRVRHVGVPANLDADARAGLAAALDAVEAGIDPDFRPTAFPAQPGEDAAFSAYLDQYCPA